MLPNELLRHIPPIFLGGAHLTLPGRCDAGIIDVPEHEHCLLNMLDGKTAWIRGRQIYGRPVGQTAAG